jgi:hypothetical protein
MRTTVQHGCARACGLTKNTYIYKVMWTTVQHAYPGPVDWLRIHTYIRSCGLLDSIHVPGPVDWLRIHKYIHM